MARLLLDTGPLIRVLRGYQPTVRLVRGLGASERLAISTLTRMEIRAGMHPNEEYVTQRLLSRFENLPFDSPVADRTGSVIRKCRLEGVSISIPDAIIAATALSYNLTLITFNHAHFEPVGGLRLYPLD
jgi:predicted nucleic acid-binding protein